MFSGFGSFLPSAPHQLRDVNGTLPSLMVVSSPRAPVRTWLSKNFLPFVANYASLASVDWCPLHLWLAALEFAIP